MPDPVHPDPGAASGEGLRWVADKDLPGVFDLVNEDGDRLSYVMPCRGVAFVGYFIRPGRRKYQRRFAFLETSDNLPTEAAARAWVEDQVLRSRAGGA